MAKVPAVGTAIGSDAAWTLPAAPAVVGQLRRHAAAFAQAAGAPEEVVQAVALAVSETVTNAVIHAYAGAEPGPVTVACRSTADGIVVEVADEGIGIAARHDSPGAGQGLAIVGAVVQALDVGLGPSGRGTVVTMSFAATAATPSHEPPATGLEPLCALALDTVADVSSVDVVTGGVLRRVAAAVAGDARLTEWLRGALPPARPGTATWAALRGGVAQLVVHDPDVPRVPGGTGERLGLAWWVAVPVGGGQVPAALWGLGGRTGGCPVPSEDVLQALTTAAGTDLADAERRKALGAALASATA